MLYRCELEELGGTWLKLGKTKNFVDKLLCNVGTFLKKSLLLSGSVLHFRPRGPEIKSCESQLFSVFFLFLDR